jgi:hypothetical protein
MASPPQAPAFLVYLYGHLRSFPLISQRQLEQFDTFAGGAPYLVFLHAWSELDHREQVWWRGGEAATNWASIDVPELLLNTTLNGLAPRLAASTVEPHPGLGRFRAGLEEYDGWCVRGTTCASDVRTR